MHLRLGVYKGPKSINKEMVNLEIHDTSGDENLSTNRKIVYKDADLFFLCVAVNNRNSLTNITRWKSELQDVEP